MKNNKLNAAAFIYKWVDETGIIPKDTGSLSDMLVAYGNKLVTDGEIKAKCPACGSEMSGFVLTHYKCKNCNESFTD